MIERFVAASAPQSEAKISERPGLFEFMGSDNGFLAVVGAPGVRSFADTLLADKGGISRTLASDPNGIRTVLDLRSQYGTPQRTLTDPAKYVDISYLRKALD